MFSRANISANYKKYTKCIKSVKNTIDITQQNAKSVVTIIQEKIEKQKEKVGSYSQNERYKMNVDYTKDEQEYLRRLGIKEFSHIDETSCTNDSAEYLRRLGVNEFRHVDENSGTNNTEEYLRRLGVAEFADIKINKQNTIKSTPIFENCKHAIGILQDKMEKGKNKVYNLQPKVAASLKNHSGSITLTGIKVAASLKNHRFTLGAGFMGTSSPVTVTGYSQNDLDLLKQLGIVESTNNAGESASASTNTEVMNESSANSSNECMIEGTNTQVVDALGGDKAFVSDVASIPDVNAMQADFPTSLFDNNYSYQSIFDNMPPEEARNDIYTTICNTFSESQTKISTTVDDILVTSPSDTFENQTENYIDVHDILLRDNLNDTTNFENVTQPQTTHSLESVPANSEIQTNIPASDLPINNEASSALINPGVNGVGSEQIINANSDKIEPVVELIPEPPPIPEGVATETVSQVNALGEATLESLGLGGWTPVGIVQNCFEFLHVSMGLPWWGTIAVGTVVIRFLLFPLVVIAQRNAAKMNNHLPQMQVLQLKMTEARQSGNQLEVARYSQELMMFMKEKKLNPLKNMIVPFAQMPVFISFFVGLRQMANVPVDSLRTGGMLWFTDLTVPDQFFALPIITSLTLWATIELGTDSAKLSSQNLQTMKYVLRALPVVILPFTVNFPGAILCYWVSSNFISLAQVGFLRIPTVRDYFKIEPLIKHQNLPVKNKGFVGGIKESWTNIKITKELEERRRVDELQFQRAGRGPLVKTYKYDPTKQVSGKPAVSAKNR